MNGKDILTNLSYVDEDLIQEAEDGRFNSNEERLERAPRLKKVSRPILIAAIIAGLLLLAGCGTVVYKLATAESPLFNLPRLGGTDISYDDIQLTAERVTPAGLYLHCKIDNDAFPDSRTSDTENAIFILSGAPYTLEKKTDSGWAMLPKKIEDATWMADDVLTDGSYGWEISWGGVYGLLDAGTYRLTTLVIEGQPEVSVEFTIEAAENAATAQAIEKCNQALQALMDQTYYHAMVCNAVSYGDLSLLPEGCYIGEDHVSYSEYFKSGEDYLELYMREAGVVSDGSMKKDGVKYRLDNEVEGDSNSPTAGWSVWPDLDDERLAGWIGGYALDPRSVIEESIEVTQNRISVQVKQEDDSAPVWGEASPVTVSFCFDSQDTLREIQTEMVRHKANGFDVDVTYTTQVDFFDTAPQVIQEKLAEQDVNFYREFSWKADQKDFPALDVKFRNTSPAPISTAPEAIVRAMNECTVEYTKIVVYRDEKAGIWKVEFQILYGFQGYQYVYIDDDGITQMISGTGSKVAEWKKDFPDPQ